MSERISVISPTLPPIRMREVLRYMGAEKATDEMQTLLAKCTDEARDAFVCRVCFRVFDVRTDGDGVDLGFARGESRALRKNLDGCDRAVLFAATVGLEIDRLITRYSRLSPSRALCFQALGAERIEALCDAFEEELRARYAAEGKVLRPRFSPGYGDLSLELQRDIFRALDCPRQIGLSLNESLLMTPTKSVTAVIGIRKR